MAAGFATRVEASELYAVTDKGSWSVLAPTSNLFGVNLLRIDDSGAITWPPNNNQGSPYNGPIPSSMGALIWNPQASPDGQYVVGTAYDSKTGVPAWGAFLAHDGQATLLGHLPGASPAYNSSAAYSVNDSGTAVGQSGVTSTGVYTAFSYNKSTGMSPLGTLGGSSSAAFDINSAGMIVGTSTNASGSDRAFLYAGSRTLDLNSMISPALGWTLVSATGINDHGSIVGWGTDRLGYTHELVLTPVPNPQPVPEASSVLAWVFIGAVTACARRSRILSGAV
jgi:probable HAF family extracellular repeat protein